MKTTSYEISKKLAKIGFKAESNFYWYCYDRGDDLRHISEADGAGNFKSYDLETILEALPKKYGYNNHLGVYPAGVGYLVCDCSLTTEAGRAEFVYRENNESLADTAALLLILLHEKGLLEPTSKPTSNNN